MKGGTTSQAREFELCIALSRQKYDYVRSVDDTLSTFKIIMCDVLHECISRPLKIESFGTTGDQSIGIASYRL